MDLRNILPNDRTEGCLAACFILVWIRLFAIMPVALLLLFWGLSGTR